MRAVMMGREGLKALDTSWQRTREILAECYEQKEVGAQATLYQLRPEYANRDDCVEMPFSLLVTTDGLGRPYVYRSFDLAGRCGEMLQKGGRDA